MFALTPCQCITMNAASTPTGSATTATKAERRWNRNTAQTSADDDELLDELVAQVVDGAVDELASGRRSARLRRPPAGSGFERRRASPSPPRWWCGAFLPERITTTPPATSPSPSSSAMPRRISGPICTIATSREQHRRRAGHRQRNGAEVVERLQVAARADHVLGLGHLDDRAARWPGWPSAAPPSPCACVTPSARIRSGSSTTWYCLTMPPMLATSATSGTRLQLELQEPVVERAQLAEVVPAAAVDQRVLVDPADAGRIRPERGAGAGAAAGSAPGSGTRRRASAPSTGRSCRRTARRRTSRRRSE